MSKPQEYWDDRALERLTLIERNSSQYFDQIAKLYTNAKLQIYADIERILAKYIKDAGLGIEEARELLTVRDSQDFLDGLRKQLTTVEDPQIRRQLLNQLNAPAYRARISRLQAVEASIDTHIKMIAPQESAILRGSLISTADLSYYRTLYDYQRGTGLGFSFNGLSEEVLKRALDENWSGQDFSKRIWTNTDIVASRTKDIVQQNVMTGRSWRRCQQDLTGYVDTRNAGAEYAAERLLRTETNHIHNEITAEAHMEMGVKKYKYLATLDGRTSLICQKHDGIIDPDTKEDYTYENKKVGVNFPPLHPFCRSVINARLDPAIEARLVRRAKDPITGKISTVAYNMTYPEWIASLIPTKASSANMSDHAMQQAEKRGISRKSIDDALLDPLSVGKVKYDDQGRKSIRVVGKTAEVAYNPDTGVIVSVNPTHSKKAKKLQEGKDGN